MTGKITVFPVPVTREPSEDESSPERMAEELERLREENAVLRERLAAVQTIALEREDTIEDLRHTLQMLPSTWAQKLGEAGDPGVDGDGGTPGAASEDVAASPVAVTAPSVATEPIRGKAPTHDQAEILFAEVAALRARLERKRLEAEQEILEQERQRLLADLEWTRRWRRSRGAQPAS